MDERIVKFFKFVVFSLSAGIIQLTLFLILDNFTSFPWAIKYLIPLIVSIVWNFLLNYTYTFRSDKNKWNAFGLVVVYYLIFVPVSTGITTLLVDNCGADELLIEIVFMLINFLTEYAWQSLVIYKSPIIPESWKRKS